MYTNGFMVAFRRKSSRAPAPFGTAARLARHRSLIIILARHRRSRQPIRTSFRAARKHDYALAEAPFFC
jgi:hypothetical protein